MQNLELDPVALAELGVDYVISAVEISNHRANGLEPKGIFEHEDSPWQIHLYQLSPAPDPAAP